VQAVIVQTWVVMAAQVRLLWCQQCFLVIDIVIIVTVSSQRAPGSVPQHTRSAEAAMSAALRQVLRQVQQEAPQLARSVRTSAAPSKAPGYHYVSATTMPSTPVVIT
jgi:hypothetical protein